MGEQERHTVLSKAIARALTSPEGLRIPVAEGSAVIVRMTSTEVVLFARPRTLGSAEEAATPPSGQSPPPDTRERENKRVRVSGNVASVPKYAPLPNKSLRVGFILAEHPEGEATHFHRVYATGDYARRVQVTNPLKGDRVTVDAERQVLHRTEKGAPKAVQALYCYSLRVAVRPRRNHDTAKG